MAFMDGMGQLFEDPLLFFQSLIPTVSGIQESVEGLRMRNHPNLLAMYNDQIRQYNAARQEGWTPLDNLRNYSQSQVAQNPELMRSVMGLFGELGGGTNVPMPDFSGLALPGVPAMDSRDMADMAPPGEALGEMRPSLLGQIATGQKPIQNAIRNWFDNLLGKSGEEGVPSYQQGITSVPNNQMAILHQGEAVIPAQQNPAQLPPGVPGQPLQPAQGGLPPVNNIANQLPAPGLNPQVQEQLLQRASETVSNQQTAQERNLRAQAAAGGLAGTGALDRRLFENQLNANAQRLGFERDLGIEAENRRFQDAMAQAQLGLEERLGMGQLGLGQQSLGLQRELGLGQLGLGERAQQWAETSGAQQIELQRQQQALQELLGTGQLGIQERGQTLAEQLGMGQLGLQERQTALQELLGTGQLGIQERGQTLAEQLGLGQLGLAEQQQQFEQGTQFEEMQRQFQQTLAQQAQLGNRGMDIQELLGQRGLDIQQLLGERGLDLQQGIHQDLFGLNTTQAAVNTLLQLLGRQDQLAGTEGGAAMGQDAWWREMQDRLAAQMGITGGAQP
jgi:hypothetical protein